jgi:hypothetical protein
VTYCSLDRTLKNPASLIGMYSLVGRIKLMARIKGWPPRKRSRTALSVPTEVLRQYLRIFTRWLARVTLIRSRNSPRLAEKSENQCSRVYNTSATGAAMF